MRQEKYRALGILETIGRELGIAYRYDGAPPTPARAKRSNGRPETASAGAQGALDRLEAGAHRVLRAASVLGRTFRGQGVAELVGGAEGVRGW